MISCCALLLSHRPCRPWINQTKHKPWYCKYSPIRLPATAPVNRNGITSAIGRGTCDYSCSQQRFGEDGQPCQSSGTNLLYIAGHLHACHLESVVPLTQPVQGLGLFNLAFCIKCTNPEWGAQCSSAVKLATEEVTKLNWRLCKQVNRQDGTPMLLCYTSHLFYFRDAGMLSKIPTGAALCLRCLVQCKKAWRDHRPSLGCYGTISV